VDEVGLQDVCPVNRCEAPLYFNVNKEARFAAPWSLAVKIITAITLALLLGTSLFGLWALPESTPDLARLLMIGLPPMIVLTTLPFAVRGYVIVDRELRIERVGWQNRIPLADVVTVTADPQAMRWSIRLFGSGGLFGFFGWFRNRKLGTYRAYGTDPKNSAVLKLKSRTIVVTPHDPARFVAELQPHLKPAADAAEQAGGAGGRARRR